MENCDNPVSSSITSHVPASIRRHHHRHNVKSRYEFLKTLGTGTYGKVKLARHKESNQLVAVKTIRKDKVKHSVDMKHIRREMEIMSSIHHPHIIQIYEVFENQDKIVIVMEYAAGGELYDYLASRKGVSDDEARLFFRQIVSAVSYCHQMGIVHRDLKLENILLDDQLRIKIADFGLANIFAPDSLLNTFCGSPLYASPEIVCGVPYTGPEVDSWSLGVLLYTLVYGNMPFDGRNFSLLTKQITSGSYCMPSQPSDAHDLISWMLTVDSKYRATIPDIAGHSWVNVADDSVQLDSTPTASMTCFQNYLQRSLEPFESRDEFDPALRESGAVDESVPPKSILKRSPDWWDRGDDETSPESLASIATDDDLAGQLAAVCGLHAKDSLKLKSKPHGVSGKRRVLRSKRDRESGYYSSPERPSAQKADSSANKAKVLPNIKRSLVTKARIPRLSAKRREAAAAKPPLQPHTKECYLAPMNQSVDERLVSVSSDDGYSAGTRPASTYSDSSILSCDSFDLCTFDKTKFTSNNQDQASPNKKRHTTRPPLSVATSDCPKDETFIDEPPAGTLTPKSEKFVRDIRRILAPSGKRHEKEKHACVPETGKSPQTTEGSQLSSMVNQLTVELDVAYKKAVNNLKSAEV